MTELDRLVRDADIIVTLSELTTTRNILVCCGSGGVGKTTVAAALALEGARQGRRACVVTIDPAKRLADALGLEALSNTPSKIEGAWSGELWAMMLDTKSTFDDLVMKHSVDPGQANRILGNRFYKNISGALSGTQEYMAMEKLYELHCDHDFDLVVVDTPPTRHALDFLDAPRRLTRFLDHRLYRILMAPTRGLMKAANVAKKLLLQGEPIFFCFLWRAGAARAYEKRIQRRRMIVRVVQSAARLMPVEHRANIRQRQITRHPSDEHVERFRR